MLDIYSQPFPNLQKYFKKILAQTLIITGEKDFINPPIIGSRLNKLIKNSQLVEIPNATHFAHLENPDLFYKELNLFLAKR